MYSEEAIYLFALTRIKGIGAITARRLVEAAGSAKALLTSPLEDDPGMQTFVHKVRRRLDIQAIVGRAAELLRRMEQRGIGCLHYGESAYPARLTPCCDAPLVLFYRGTVEPLSLRHAVAIVGTRNATFYGKAMCEQLVGEMAERLSSPLVISGLAYGVDIAAHRAALARHVPTVAVLAHGLDRVYPFQHKREAESIVEGGGALLSEYPIDEEFDRHQFVARNRIVAGLSEATVVVESDIKGGALLTASMAAEYGRETFAIPGRLTDRYSAGCNAYIAQGKALALRGVDDLMAVMGWPDKAHQAVQEEAQPDLFAASEEVGHPVLQVLRERETVSFDELVSSLGIPPAQLSSDLIDLECDGHIISLPGGRYTRL